MTGPAAPAAALPALLCVPVAARTAGEFDHDVLSLSWSPNWCALEGDDRTSVQCDEGYIQEARICLTRDDLTPRDCGADLRRDCALDDALLDSVR